MASWEIVMGLETHVELSTKTKIFCGCTTAFGGAPNTHCCPVCTGRQTLPGENDLEALYPDLAAQWDEAKNGALHPSNVTAGSNRRVWWRCEKGHS